MYVEHLHQYIDRDCMFHRRKLLESYVVFTLGHAHNPFFGEMFTSASEFHNYPTNFAERNSLYVHVAPNKRGKMTIRHLGRKLWNIVLDA